MKSNQEPKINKFETLITWAEKLFLVALIVGFFMQYFDSPESRIVQLISLSGLAIVFFASAFLPKEIFSSQEEADQYGPFGMLDFLALTIAPKVLWVSSAVSVFGIIGYIANFGNDGYFRILAIGASSIIFPLLILTIAVINGNKKLSIVATVLYRAIPLLFIAVYLLLM